MRPFRTYFAAIALGLACLAPTAQAEPLHIVIDGGVIEPMPFAVPDFIPENNGAGELARDIARVVAADLNGTGLFRELSSDAYISKVTSFDAPIAYKDWQAINTEALITGSVSASGDRVVVKFRLYDIVSGQPLGDGLQFAGSANGWRRMAHKVADAVYSRITGEGGFVPPPEFTWSSAADDELADRLKRLQ